MCRFFTPQIIFIFIVACVGRILYAGVEQAGAAGVEQAGAAGVEQAGAAGVKKAEATGVEKAGATERFAPQLFHCLKQFKMNEEQQKKLSILTGIVAKCQINAELDAKFTLAVFKISENNIMEFASNLVRANCSEEQAKYYFMIINRCPLVVFPDSFKGTSAANYMQRKASEKKYPINLGEPTGEDNTETVNKILQIPFKIKSPSLLEKFLQRLKSHTDATEVVSETLNKIIGAMEAAATELIGKQSEVEPRAEQIGEKMEAEPYAEQIGEKMEAEPYAELIGEMSDVKPCADSYVGQVMYLLNLIQMSKEQRTMISTLSANFGKYETYEYFNSCVLSTVEFFVETNIEPAAKHFFKMINRYPRVFLPDDFKVTDVMNYMKLKAKETEYPINLGEPTGDDHAVTVEKLSSANRPTILKEFFDSEETRCGNSSLISKNIGLLIEYIIELVKDPNTTDPEKINPFLKHLTHKLGML